MFEARLDHESVGSDGWFVYLLALTDCTAFKVGFTCNPLQRLYAFNHRYFEVIDLDESVLLPVLTIDAARELEADLKNALSPHRASAPSWVSLDAGGHTEWFSAVYFRDAIQLLREFANVQPTQLVFDLRSQLKHVLLTHREPFERWLVDQVRQIETLAQSAKTVALARERQYRLRDWWDVYRRLGIEIFTERPDVRDALIQYVRSM